MEMFWLWCWRRFGHRYSWLVFAGAVLSSFQILMTLAWVVLRFENSDRYGIAFALSALGSLSIAGVGVLPGVRSAWGQVEAWQSDRPASARAALESTYAFARKARRRGVIVFIVANGASAGAIGAAAGAATGRIAQYTVTGAGAGAATFLVAIHFYFEAFLRPVRRDIAGDSSVGDDLPRARPSFATWSTIALLATIWVFTLGGALLGATFASVELPVMAALIATVMLVFFGVPITLSTSFAPSLQPIGDLTEGTRRVAAGDFGRRLPVDQDDDLGVLAASFNRMQAGLAERERLQAAFGSYVDPALAERLLAQGDELFSGERVEVTVMFVDIRDFTPFAEANTADDTVAHLNALFEIVVESVNQLGGHVNKFLGDGALVVFGAPERIEDHADQAVAAAIDIQRHVGERFDGSTRVGIGINTGAVIAGTIGGAGKLEFTLIGDAVNVAARVEQLTKTTNDAILITDATAIALRRRPSNLRHRGAHEVRGKTEPIGVHAIDPHESAPTGIT